MMTRRGLLLTGTLGGCSILPTRPYLERRMWPLEARRPAIAAPNRRGPVLLIRTVRAAPGLEGQGLQTIQADGSVQVAFYERWEAPPAEAVEDQLRRWLSASGLFAGVSSPGSRAHADLAMESELLTLIAAPAQGTSRAALGFVLVDLRRAQPGLLLQAEETGTASLAGQLPAHIAASCRAALASLFGAVEQRLAAALR